MTQNELNRFQEVLTAKVAKLERLTRRLKEITIERSAKLRNASVALRQIQEGSFGTCQPCNANIHPS